MYCPKCGKENREGARFCSGCGTPLKQAPAPEKQQKQEKKEPRESRQSQEFRKPQEPRKVPESQEDQWVNEVKIQYKDKSLPPLTEAPLLAKKKKEGKKRGLLPPTILASAPENLLQHHLDAAAPHRHKGRPGGGSAPARSAPALPRGAARRH